jgi:hypothetical protein
LVLSPRRRSSKLLMKASTICIKRPRPHRDGGSVSALTSAGRGGEEGKVELSVAVADLGRFWRSEASSSSIISAACFCRPTSNSPISGDCQTSCVRPFSRLVPAYYGDIVASGLVPAPVFDGGAADLRLVGREREGLNCFLFPICKVFSAFIRDPCVFYNLMGSFVTICNPLLLFLI